MSSTITWPSGSIVDVRSVSQLLQFLAEGKLDRYTMVWRGVANIGWPLDPGAIRKLARESDRSGIDESVLREAEDGLLQEARRLRFDRRGDGSRLSDLELLATLQHQGAATRLLDVTLNALIGAWFVVEDETERMADGALFGIDVTGREVPAELLSEDARVKDIVSRPGTWLWRPPPLDQRMRAQQAAFLLSAVPDPVTPPTSLDLTFPRQRADRLFEKAPGSGRYAKRAVVIFRIPADVKKDLRAFLTKRLGYDLESLYPDLSGFARARRA